jgi:hypothetical protein
MLSPPLPDVKTKTFAIVPVLLSIPVSTNGFYRSAARARPSPDFARLPMKYPELPRAESESVVVTDAARTRARAVSLQF